MLNMKFYALHNHTSVQSKSKIQVDKDTNNYL